MLKMLKWVYALGVEQERMRISAHLKNIKQDFDLKYNQNSIIFNDEKTSKRRKMQLDFDLAVDREVRQIIHDIMSPRISETRCSIMFPEKGEE